MFQTIAKEFNSAWCGKNDDENARNLTVLLELIQRFLKSWKMILRNPTELMNFVLKLADDEKIVQFADLQCVVTEIIAQLLTNKNFFSKVSHSEDIIIKVNPAV